MPKVSVIIPVYNLEEYIGKTIESIKKQTMTDWELILVDDASRDSSLSVMKKYELEDERVRIISFPENKGPMCARECGCKDSKGEYVTFVDGDDELTPDALLQMYDAAIDNDADIVVGQMMCVSPDGTRTPYPIHAELNYGSTKIGFFKSILRGEIHQGLAVKLYHKNIIKETIVTVFEHCTMSEDAAVLFQYADNCHKVCVISSYVYLYNQRLNSSTHTNLTVAQIEGICKTSQLRLRIANNYPELSEDIIKYLTENLLGLYLARYDINVDRILDRYGLKNMTTMKNIYKHFKFKKTIRLILRRDLKPFLFKFKK